MRQKACDALESDAKIRIPLRTFMWLDFTAKVQMNL